MISTHAKAITKRPRFGHCQVLGLAESYDAAGRRDEALKMLEEMLTLSRKVNGPEHSHSLRAMQLLANSYARVGREDETLKLREEVLAVRRKSLGPEHAATLGSAKALAFTYERMGRKEDAAKLREEIAAVEAKEKTQANQP